jgi:Na+-transporting NADH:ubiquinone oxidoreductase subunit NqrB
LNILRFNWLGILIFLFLFSVINFFNALVRQPVRELLVEREKEGMIGMFIDTLSMPFVRIGKWMSTNFSRVNVFIFLFDVIIEAPFKVVVRFIREWAGFIRRKKEEII